jgi:hypothetical protein
MKTKIALIASAVLLTGCGNGGPKETSTFTTGDDLHYYTPKTKVGLTADFVLLACESSTDLKVAPSLSIAQAGGPGTEFVVRGKDLMSGRQKRELNIELSEARTIKSLNTTSSDRTGAIVSNVLKLFTTLASAITGAGAPGAATSRPPGSPCNQKTYDALMTAKNTENTLASLRNRMLTAPAAEAANLAKQIDFLALQWAGLVTGPLTVSVSSPLKIGDTSPSTGDIQWAFKDFSKWFASDPEKNPCVPALSGFAVDCDAKLDVMKIAYKIETEKVGSNIPAASNCRAELKVRDPSCATKIALANPVAGKITLEAASGNFAGVKSTEALGSENLIIAQWGEVSYIDLDVKFAESRSFGTSFDQFGRKQGIKWSSEAKAEAVTSNLNSIAGDAIKAINATKGPDDPAQTDVWDAETKRIKSRIEFNKAKACEVAAMAGATSCP